MARAALLVLPLLAAAAAGQAAAPPPGQDPFTLALQAAGLSESDLGFRPRSYWTRFPDPAGIPHLPRLFADLYAEPLRCHDVVELMALAGSTFLDPAWRAKTPNSIYKTAYFCGFEKKVAGFRAYTSCPPPTPAGEEPLVTALEGLFARAGRVFTHRILDQEADWPRRAEEIRRQLRGWPLPVRAALARAVAAAGEAWGWCQQARRRVDGKALLQAWSIRDLSETQFDGMDYYAAIDDLWADLDETSLWFGAMKAAESAEILAAELARALDGAPGWDPAGARLVVATPCGRVVVAGTGADRHAWTDALLVVDLGGDDEWLGPAGATPGPGFPLGVAVDLAGNDIYRNDDPALPAQGAGILGAGVLLDAAGNDRYFATAVAQGAGQLGAGILADLAGDDAYEAGVLAQGAAVFGVGVLLEAAGQDAYRLKGGDGQGYGGVGGAVGTLVDRAGNDSYFAEPLAARWDRRDGHGAGRINYSYAQGAGVGRRGDVSDGHSWAGGMGTLIDLAGDDRYEAGGWAQGSAYWFALGFLCDGAGDDTYLASHWSQACAAHFGVAALFEEEGDDRYPAYEENHNNLAFGHDFAVVLFVDRAGKDLYEAGPGSLGYAIRMSHALFLDLAGDDRYRFPAGGPALGETDAPRREARPGLDFSYEIYARQAALFLDAGGRDAYQAWDRKAGEARGNDGFADGGRLLRPADDPRHRGLFLDLKAPAGMPIPWLGPRFR